MDLHKIRTNRFQTFMGESQFKPFFQDFHLLEVDHDYEYPTHVHQRFEVIVVVKGPYSCTLNNVEIEVNNSQLLLIQPGDIHQDHLKTGQIHYVLHFELISESNIWSKPEKLLNSGTNERNQVITAVNWEPIHFFRWMEQQRNRMDQKDQKDLFTLPYLQDSLMETFFWELIGHFQIESLSSDFLQETQEMTFKKRIHHLFRTNLYKSLSVAEMADKLFMSPRNLNYLCQKYLQTSPARAFLEYQMQCALDLIKLRQKSIYEISDYLGFNNQFHFSRAFKRLYGQSPQQFQTNLDKN